MNAVGKIFLVGMRQILRDGMLLFLLPAPFLMGAALRVLLPLADRLLTSELNVALSPWYPLSDAFVLTMAPVMTAMVCAFVILDERDEGVGTYYRITPSGTVPYLLARLGIPMVWAFTSSILVVLLFSLSQPSLSQLIVPAVIASLQGVISCMVLAAIAGNKVEGLALAKLTNLFILGLPVPWFLDTSARFIFSFLPSFWIGEITLLTHTSQSPLPLFQAGMGVLVAFLWIAVMFQAFLRRTYG